MSTADIGLTGNAFVQAWSEKQFTFANGFNESERVRRSLQRQGLRSVYKRPYQVTTDSNHRLPVAPNMLQRRFDRWCANQAWLSDITVIATAEGWVYLAAVLDLASRRIVGWSMSADQCRTSVSSPAQRILAT